MAQPLEQITVLDAGCGTGNYALEIAPHVGRVLGVDLSDSMLGKARQKSTALGFSEDRVRFQLGDITDLPFSDGSIDAAMTNQVLHHLHDTSETGFTKHRSALLELARVIRPGGVLTINLCTHAQLKHGFWFHDLYENAFSQLREFYMPLPQLKQMLLECGFQRPQSVVPIDAVFQGESYFDPSGPLQEEWRNGDSVFSLATDEEIESASQEIRELIDSNRMADYFADKDARRSETGQVTFLWAVRKP